MEERNSQVEKQRQRFTGSATKAQMQQMQIMMKELRWSRSKIIRLPIGLVLETHRQDPKRYGV